MDKQSKNLRDADFSTSAKDVSSTKMLDGLAKDSLSGKNELKQYEQNGKPSGPFGGKNSGS